MPGSGENNLVLIQPGRIQYDFIIIFCAGPPRFPNKEMIEVWTIPMRIGYPIVRTGCY
jgi:hypothetical protein